VLQGRLKASRDAPMKIWELVTLVTSTSPE
jgi:hypothetical protein